MERRRIDAITDKQMSLIATRQFEKAGGSVGALKWALRDRWLEPYRWRGVHRVVGSAPVLYQPLMGACLAGGDDAFACDLGAAWLYGVPDVAPALEIGAPRSLRLAGVRARRLGLDPQFIEARFNVPVVAPALCVVQVARRYEILGQKVANNLVGRGITGFLEILQCLEALAPSGPGSLALRKFLLKELEVSGHDDSPAARALGRALLHAGLGPFETQFVVDLGDGVALLDFAWPEVMVGVEYQGRADHARTHSQIDADARRRARLSARGWQILDATAGISRGEVVQWTAATLRLRANGSAHSPSRAAGEAG